jgi:hypothetical protein
MVIMHTFALKKKIIRPVMLFYPVIITISGILRPERPFRKRAEFSETRHPGMPLRSHFLSKNKVKHQSAIRPAKFAPGLGYTLISAGSQNHFDDTTGRILCC